MVRGALVVRAVNDVVHALALGQAVQAAARVVGDDIRGLAARGHDVRVVAARADADGRVLNRDVVQVRAAVGGARARGGGSSCCSGHLL